MKRILWLSVRVLLAGLVVLYLADWAVLRVRMARGTGYETVQVEEYLATPLKGSKDEYDYMGTRPEPCSRSIFPHGAPPCWWLTRHTSHWE
jgi:hypothetical protein